MNKVFQRVTAVLWVVFGLFITQLPAQAKGSEDGYQLQTQQYDSQNHAWGAVESHYAARAMGDEVGDYCLGGGPAGLDSCVEYLVFTFNLSECGVFPISVKKKGILDAVHSASWVEVRDVKGHLWRIRAAKH